MKISAINISLNSYFNFPKRFLQVLEFSTKLLNLICMLVYMKTSSFINLK
jgi:hypothetical protein